MSELEDNLIKISAIKDQGTKLWTLKNILFRPGIQKSQQVQLLEFMVNLGLPYSTWQCLIHNQKSGSIVRSVALFEMASLARTLFEYVGVYFEAGNRTTFKRESFLAMKKCYASASEWEAVWLIARDRSDKALEKLAFRNKKEPEDSNENDSDEDEDE